MDMERSANLSDEVTVLERKRNALNERVGS